MREPIEMLVQVLVNGGRVTDDGKEYAMAEDGSLCVVMHDDFGNELPMKVDCDLAGIKRMADDIGQNELWLKCCELQLRSVSAT